MRIPLLFKLLQRMNRRQFNQLVSPSTSYHEVDQSGQVVHTYLTATKIVADSSVVEVNQIDLVKRIDHVVDQQ